MASVDRGLDRRVWPWREIDGRVWPSQNV